MSYGGYPLEEMESHLLWLSRWLDEANKDRDPEARTWGRLAKVAEECGEVIAAYIAATGQNPRKGVPVLDDEAFYLEDVKKELLDVALTALAAYEHVDGHRGRSAHDLKEFLAGRVARAQRTLQMHTAELFPEGVAEYWKEDTP